MDCIFCNIINKEISSDIVYEDANFIAFKDINPVAPIHLLLVPKVHISSFNDLKEKHKDLIGDLFLLAKKIAKQQKISHGYKLNFRKVQLSGILLSARKARFQKRKRSKNLRRKDALRREKIRKERERMEKLGLLK